VAKLRYSAAAGDSGSPPFLQGIQEALAAAAGALLQLMCGPGPQGRLLSWLHCLKHFFLMDQVRADLWSLIGQLKFSGS
jgi:hypothetical protein